MPKRVLIGTVVSNKGDKTVTVRVERRVQHPLYGKIIRRSKKYHAHDADNAFRAGEQVRIEECAPISKLKSWTVVERIGAAKAAVVEIDEPVLAASPTEESARDKAKAKSDRLAEEAAEQAAAEKKPSKPAKEKAEKKPAKASKGAKGKDAKADAEDVAEADA